MFATIGPALPMIAAGKARALGVTSIVRSSSLPNVPTIAEQGLKDYEAVLRFFMVGPIKMPAPVTALYQSNFKQIMLEPNVVSELKKLGNDDIVPKTPVEIQSMIQSDYRKWGAVIKDAKITLDS